MQPDERTQFLMTKRVPPPSAIGSKSSECAAHVAENGAVPRVNCSRPRCPPFAPTASIGMQPIVASLGEVVPTTSGTLDGFANALVRTVTQLAQTICYCDSAVSKAVHQAASATRSPNTPNGP